MPATGSLRTRGAATITAIRGVGPVVNALDPAFGVVGDGVADDRPGLAAAVASAIAQQRPLYVPAGNYNPVMTVAHPSLPITGDLRIVGGGQYSTRIKMGPDAPSGDGTDYILFDVAANVNFSISHVELAGPATVDTLTNQDQFPGHTGGITVGVNVGDCTTEARVELDHVRMTGKFYQTIEVPGGSGLGHLDLVITDCDLTSYAQIIAFFGPNGADRTLTCTRTRFRNSGVPPEDNQGIVRGEMIYIHPSLNVDFDRCRFDQTRKYCIHMHSGSTANAPARFARFRNCLWGPGITTGNLFSETTHVEITGGEFFGTGVFTIPISATITGMKFDPDDTQFVLEEDPGFSPTVKLMACWFGNNFRAFPMAGEWQFIDCTSIRGVAAGTGIAAPIQPAGTSTVTVDGGRWFGGAGANVANAAVAASGSARVVVRRARFDGNYNYHPYDGALQCYESATLQAEDNIFDIATGAPALTTDGTSAVGALRGRNNWFKNGLPSVTGNAQYLTGRPGLATAPIASAATVTVDISFDRATLTGTATVSTIIPGSTAAALGFAGTYTFRCQDGCTFATGGNIASLRTTGARPAGSLATFDYDPARGRWDER